MRPGKCDQQFILRDVRRRAPPARTLRSRGDEDRLQTTKENNIMEIGFIGLGKMGFPMARRLIEAGHQLTVFDTRKEAADKLAAMGAQVASSPKDIAARCETVLASLPSLQASLDVATGTGGVIEGKRVKRFVDLSTVGSQMATRIHGLLAK